MLAATRACTMPLACVAACSALADSVADVACVTPGALAAVRATAAGPSGEGSGNLAAGRLLRCDGGRTDDAVLAKRGPVVVTC